MPSGAGRPPFFCPAGMQEISTLMERETEQLTKAYACILKKNPKFLKENFLKVWISNSESQGMEANLQSLWQENQIQLAKRQTPGDPENGMLTQCTSKEEEHPVIECPPPSLLFCGKAWRGSKINNQIPKFWDEEQNHLLPHHLKKNYPKKRKRKEEKDTSHWTNHIWLLQRNSFLPLCNHQKGLSYVLGTLFFFKKRTFWQTPTDHISKLLKTELCQGPGFGKVIFFQAGAHPAPPTSPKYA